MWKCATLFPANNEIPRVKVSKLPCARASKTRPKLATLGLRSEPCFALSRPVKTGAFSIQAGCFHVAFVWQPSGCCQCTMGVSEREPVLTIRESRSKLRQNHMAGSGWNESTEVWRQKQGLLGPRTNGKRKNADVNLTCTEGYLSAFVRWIPTCVLPSTSLLMLLLLFIFFVAILAYRTTVACGVSSFCFEVNPFKVFSPSNLGDIKVGWRFPDITWPFKFSSKFNVWPSHLLHLVDKRTLSKRYQVTPNHPNHYVLCVGGLDDVLLWD